MLCGVDKFIRWVGLRQRVMSHVISMLEDDGELVSSVKAVSSQDVTPRETSVVVVDYNSQVKEIPQWFSIMMMIAQKDDDIVTFHLSDNPRSALLRLT